MNLSKEEMQELEKSIEEMFNVLIKPIFNEILNVNKELYSLMHMLRFKGYLLEKDIMEIKRLAKDEE